MASTESAFASQEQTIPRTAPRSSTHSVTQTTNIPSLPLPQQAVLRLRGARTQNVDSEGEGEVFKKRQKIHWAEDVVDNEGLGKKKSKVCCIYHAPKGIDESSDESSSDSNDSESADDGAARPVKGGKKSCDDHAHGGHNHNHGHAKKPERKSSLNAYERLPKPRKGGTNEKT